MSQDDDDRERLKRRRRERAAAAGYLVGYCKTPAQHEFSADNQPKRRRKRRVKEHVDVAEEPVRLFVSGIPRQMPLGDAIKLGTGHAALAGDVRARSDWLRHIEPKRRPKLPEYPAEDVDYADEVLRRLDLMAERRKANRDLFGPDGSSDPEPSEGSSEPRPDGPSDPEPSKE